MSVALKILLSILSFKLWATKLYMIVDPNV